MALSAATVWEIEQAGSDTSGGGFVTGASGTDWSQQTSPQYSVTDGVTAGSTTITSASAAFGTDVVGNIISVSGGTGAVSQNWYQISSRTNATTIVVDRSTGLTAGTGVTLKIGGAFATPCGFGLAYALIAVAGMKTWQKYSATAYSVTTSTSNVSGGVLTTPSGISMNFEGYDQARGDRTGNRPKNLWTAAAPGALTYMLNGLGGGRQRFANLLLDGGSVNNVGGLNSSASGQRASITQSVIQNFNGTAGVGINLQTASASIAATAIQAINNTTSFQNGNFARCWASGGTTGFLNGVAHTKCIATGCTNGFSSNSTPSYFDNCTADSNTTSGFVVSTGSQLTNCLSSNQSGAGGIGFSVGTNISTLENCASYNNLTEISGTPFSNEGMILNASFTGGQPYVSAGSDYRPNATAGAGALLRNAGIGMIGQTDNVDIGAVQHSDPSGGGNTYIFQVES